MAAFSGLLGVSLIAFLASGGVMFLFASHLGARIRRLRDAAERALDREGRVTPFPLTRSRDEVGDLTRSFASLLDQVAAYTDYLRSLSGKLSHELNTPLAIVQRATLPQQRHAVTTLGQLQQTLHEQQLGSPSVIIVGDVLRGLAQMQATSETTNLQAA